MRRAFWLTAIILPVLIGCALPTQAVTPEPAPGGGCYYVWATQELEDLSAKVNRTLQKTDPALSGGAYAFGENCVYADGHTDFSTMETDFRVTVRVNNLKDEEALGDWIIKAMQALGELPKDEIPGPQAGRVDFMFEKNKSEQLYIHVPIKEYEALEAGLSGAEVYRHFQPGP
jgi:hypothetical protein